MDKFEQEIKNRLAKDSSMAGIESETLWSAIAQASNPAAVPEKKKRFILLWFLGAAVVGGLVWSALLTSQNLEVAYSPRGENEGIQSNYFSVLEDDEETELSFNKNEEVEVRAVSAVQNTINSTKENAIKIPVNKEINSLNSTTTNTQNPTKLAEYRTEKSPIELQKTILIPVANNEEVNPNLGEIEEISEGNNDSFVYESLGSTNELLPGKDSSEEIANYTLQRITSRKGDFPRKPYINRVFEPAHSPKVKRGIPLNIYAGLVTVQNKFENSSAVPGLADSLDTSISVELGGRLGVSYRISKGNNWNLNIGLEYSQWNDRFDKVLVSDTLVFETPSSQELSPAINIRTIRHYNKLSSLSIPVEFELFKDTETLRFGLGLGASYSVVFGQEGRLLKDEITVVDYSQRNKRYSNFLSLRATPSIGYKLSEKLMVNALCTVGIQSHGDNSFTNLKSNSLTIMPALGLRFNY
tara:strand:- start:87 stop:1493 length:1407 start_codon:yes stop_codon:yes gene_type:complete